MKTHALFSFLHLLFVSFILSLGLGSLLAAQSAPFRTSLYFFFLHLTQEQFLIFGVLLLSIASLLFFAFYKLYKPRYYQLKMRGGKSSVDHTLIEHLIEKFYREQFPELTSLPTLFVHPNQMLEIFITLPLSSPLQEKTLLTKLENKLSLFLKETLSYELPFLMTVVEK